MKRIKISVPTGGKAIRDFVGFYDLSSDTDCTKLSVFG